MIRCVYGPPGVGKSTYIFDHATENDIIFEFDSVLQAVTTKGTHEESTEEQRHMVLSMRKTFLRLAPEMKSDVWFACCRLTDEIKEALGDSCEYIELTATKDELYDRVDNDDTRPDKDKEHEKIDKYLNEQKGEDMGKKEIRSFDFEVRADENEENGKFLSGTPIVYGEKTDLGWYDEIISDGALQNTDLRDVRFLVNHNTDMIPLARSRNNNANSTMQLEVIPGKGMSIRVNLDTENNAEAKSLYSAVERGDITGMSFMFTVDEDKWEDIDTEHPKRSILSISKVFEVSAVTFPAYEATSISARGLSEALENAKESLESAKAKKAEIERRKQRIRILSEV